MAVDTQLERLYQQVVLVRGAGDRRRGRLCIMSFVAFLAGEGHTDNPRTVSGLIRRYAMPINDEMPDHLRHRLKSFAPRLIGTKDGQDPARAALLLEAARTDILPRIAQDFGHTATEAGCVRHDGKDGRKLESLHELVKKIVYLGSPEDRSTRSSASEDVAATLAHLLAHCAMAAPPSLGDWYWLKAIELLDRLCDVGADHPRPELHSDRLVSMEAFLNRRAEIQQRKVRAVATLARVRSLMPAFMR
jgi:hypothetical protein